LVAIETALLKRLVPVNIKETFLALEMSITGLVVSVVTPLIAVINTGGILYILFNYVVN